MKKRIYALVLAVIMFFSVIPSGTLYATGFPTMYRNENVTSAKNQGADGLCWCFASTSAMEAELIQNNGADKSIDLSELQLAYFRRNSPMDPLGQAHMMFSGTNDYFRVGYAQYIAAMLGTGVSPIDESMDPVPYAQATRETKFDDALAFTGKYYMRECKMVRKPSRDLVKEWILTYGSVITNYEADENNYNSKTYAWYNPSSQNTNHEVCIVGWDDTFAKENFKTTPEGDGAWIVKNSWGDKWGMNGFFYLSYYDSSILLQKTQYTVYDMEYGKYADNVYQNAFEAQDSYSGLINGKIDYSTAMNGASYSKVANVFTAQANESGGEVLKGVSLFTFVPLEYDIKIYKNVRESCNPESGTLAATVKGKISEPGFVIIPLDTPLYLSQGESYSIVASNKNEKGKPAGVAASMSYYINPTPTFFQSYTYKNIRTGWEDLAVTDNTNLYLNAYTDNVPADANADSNKVTMKVSSPGIEKLPLPKDVTGVKATHIDGDSVVLSWDKAECVEHIVYQCNTKANAWRKVGIVEQGKDYYEITGLLPGTSYKFAVKSVAKKDPNSDRDQPYLQSLNYVSVEVKTSTNVSVEPNVTKNTKGNILEWKNASNATRYEVYVLSPVTDYEWSKLATLNAQETCKYEDKNVIKGLTYMYRIYAYNGDVLLGKGTPASILFE